MHPRACTRHDDSRRVLEQLGKQAALRCNLSESAGTGGSAFAKAKKSTACCSWFRYECVAHGLVQPAFPGPFDAFLQQGFVQPLGQPLAAFAQQALVQPLGQFLAIFALHLEQIGPQRLDAHPRFAVENATTHANPSTTLTSEFIKPRFMYYSFKKTPIFPLAGPPSGGGSKHGHSVAAFRASVKPGKACMTALAWGQVEMWPGASKPLRFHFPAIEPDMRFSRVRLFAHGRLRQTAPVGCALTQH